jgi:spore germination protein KB
VKTILEKGIISIRQFILLVAYTTIGDSILVLPSILAVESQQDAWISGLIGLIAGVLVVSILSMVGRLYPHLTLVEVIQKILGNWIGSLVAIVFLVYPLFSVAAYLREMGDFMVTEMMPETPIQAILILGISICVMATSLGIEVIARTVEIFFPWVMVLFLIFILFLLPLIEIDNLKPILENGFKPVLSGSLSFTAFTFMELVVFLMIFPNVQHANKIHMSFIKGALFGGIVLIILMTISILVLGADLTARNIYPSYSLAKKVHIGTFLERVEAIIALMWILTIFCKISIFFYVFVVGLAQLLKLKEYRVLILPAALIMIALALSIVPNITYFKMVTADYWPFFDLTFAIILPLLLLAVYGIRKGFKGSERSKT